MRSKFRYLVSCPQVCIYFEKYQFEMLVVFSPIFVANTEIIVGYNFRACLKLKLVYLNNNTKVGTS